MTYTGSELAHHKHDILEVYDLSNLPICRLVVKPLILAFWRVIVINQSGEVRHILGKSRIVRGEVPYVHIYMRALSLQGIYSAGNI